MTVKSFLAAWLMLLAEYEEEMISGSDIFSFRPHRKHLQKFAQLHSKSVTSLPSSSPGVQTFIRLL